ncbi:hypothetical protein [Blastococcus sp. TBT05-19]|uniref:hypothetical protein n=1 Tax=Blastococcus sp. TBT05-19 TaxID=2250581 RepID=UPI001F294DBB|nr:hypothetical protein [Blastococcus sp. TBT05-19]
MLARVDGDLATLHCGAQRGHGGGVDAADRGVAEHPLRCWGVGACLEEAAQQHRRAAVYGPADLAHGGVEGLEVDVA